MASDSPDGRSSYLPALDGIRAIAVGAVVAYHLQVPFFDGGLLGVSVFFTLSGFLITSLLIQGFEKKGGVELADLKGFWLRRARRLLPALLLMLPVVVATTAIARPAKLAATARQALWAILYVANWTTIARGDDYFQRFSGPGPLDHLWSLAIEEQFYIVWPLLVFALLLLGLRSKWGRGPLAFVTVLLAAASTFAIAHLYDPAAMNNTRAYEGTDARAASLLIGAVAAMIVPFDRVSSISSRGGRFALEVLGLAGLAGVVTCIVRTDEFSPFLYRGGEVLLALATASLAVGASHPKTLVARALALAPLRWIGARSYGVYLWHLPVVAFMPATVLIDRPVLRGLVQAALILVLAAASFHLIEDPIRRQAFARTRRSVAFRALVLAPAATVALVVWPLKFPPSAIEAMAAEPIPTNEVVLTSATTAPTTTTTAAASVAPAVAATAHPTPLTSCREVAHVGDSTSIGLVSTLFLPNADDQIGARYRSVGVERFFPEISGARSMVETYQNQPNATEVVTKRRQGGYNGCWVFALGTNDPANTAGNVTMLSTRIDNMMAKIGDKPALWTTTKTLKEKGPYQNANMAAWNQALLAACARHPNMRVYDWANEVQDSWFLQDGIHFNGPGYKERAQRIALALARAFPRDAAPSSTCVVRATP
jgi:peptidoglycan/LPS O-acetylase OafA/YrhL